MVPHDLTDHPDQDWQVRSACTDRKLERLAVLLLQFLTRLSTPQFQDGDRVRWIPLSEDAKTDTGIIIGLFSGIRLPLQRLAMEIPDLATTALQFSHNRYRLGKRFGIAGKENK